jgi:hypothetical protein
MQLCGKKCHQTQWGKNKAPISSTSIQLAFQMTFFSLEYTSEKKPYLHYSKCYFINLALQNSISLRRSILALQYSFSIGAIKMRDESKKFLSYPFSFCFSSFLGDAFSWLSVIKSRLETELFINIPQYVAGWPCCSY